MRLTRTYSLLLALAWLGGWIAIAAEPAARANPLPFRQGQGVGLMAQSDGDDFDFSGDGRSGHRNGGGSRSDCPSVDAPLTALMPASNWGATVAASPEFWVYVPYTPEQVPVGEFVLQDADRNDLYRAAFQLPETPGLVAITLPETAPELPLEQSHRWYVSLYCDADQASSPVFVQGWVERKRAVAGLEAQLAAADRPAYRVYAENGLWFDAIATLAEQRQEPVSPSLAADWEQLLSANGVDLDLPDNLPFSGPVRWLEDSPTSP